MLLDGCLQEEVWDTFWKSKSIHIRTWPYNSLVHSMLKSLEALNVKSNQVLSLNHPLLTILTFKTRLDRFRTSKFPVECLLLLRTPLFETLFKSVTMSFVGYLLPRHNISKTIGHVEKLGGIGIFLMANHPILYHHPLSDCSVLLPFPFSILHPHWEQCVIQV